MAGAGGTMKIFGARSGWDVVGSIDGTVEVVYDGLEAL